MKFFLTTLCLVFSLTLSAQLSLFTPTSQHPGAFAIVIDQASFDNTTHAVHQYRQMLESEELSTYILSGVWRNPEQVRGELLKLYESDKRLEGVVFIGDVPVAMIRQAQHLTTAFKMNEDTFPREQSSVASDRFYDDFDLEFEYIGQDENQPLWHYYRMTDSSEQRIQSEIYSGRIKPLENGRDPYRQIESYLLKVVEDRKQNNTLDQLLSFLGYGSNSECMSAWASDQIALSQQFPHLNKPGTTFRNMSFNMTHTIVADLKNELQRENLDMALLHNHGSIDIQHISSGWMPVSSTREYVHRIQHTLHGIQISELSDEEKEARAKRLGIPLEWLYNSEFSGEYIDPETISRSGNIYVEEVDSMIPNVRLVFLDACYNGSFHHPENIAGAYIFNPGKTIVSIGNTVNVLQDNWPNQYIGLLSSGIRIGQLRQHIHSLESHIIGDPTFRFSPISDLDVHEVIRAGSTKPSVWKSLLREGNPDLAAFSLMMGKPSIDDYSDVLLDIFQTSPLHTLRMESLIQLSRINDENYHHALILSANDPFELVRRLGAAWMGKKGHREYIPALVRMLIEDPFFLRASVYNASNALMMFDSDLVAAEIDHQLQKKPYLDGIEKIREKLLTSSSSNGQRVQDWVSNMQDKSLTEEKRIDNIRFIRNYNLHEHTEAFCAIASDNTESEKIRLVMIEALGWFVHSIRKDQILETCRQILEDADSSSSVRSEANKTIRRLSVTEN
jgi:hypothetical protein